MVEPTRLSAPALVGRRDELGRLEALLDRARAGQPASVSVRGEAGIGKTRLVQELAARARGRGVVVVQGRCADVADDALPHAPFVDVVHQVVRAQGVGRVLAWAGPTADELARLAPVLADGAPPPPTPGSRARLHLAVLSLVSGLAARAPTLLVLEDLHWADAPTRDLAVLLAQRLHGPILLVVTVRTDDRPATEAHRRFLASLDRATDARLDLAGLDRAEQARQIAAIRGVPPTAAVVDRVFRRAGGNPLFAEELVADDGVAVPAGVRDLLLARVHGLPADAAELVRLAAVAGPRVTPGLLAAMVAWPDERHDRALRRAVDHHVLVADDPVLGFRHALLQEVVLEQLLPQEARRLHRRVAEALVSRPELATDAGHGQATRLAEHWARADDDRVGPAALHAARESEAALAWGTALANYERLLARTASGPPLGDGGPTRPEVLAAAAEAAALSGHAGQAVELARAAIADEASAGTDPGRTMWRAHLHERLGRYLWMAADGHGALAAFEQAVALVPPTSPPSRQRAAILAGHAQVLGLAGDHAASRRRAEQALDVARRAGADARAVEGRARNTLGVALAWAGEVDAGLAELDRAHRIAEDGLEDVDDVGRAVINRAAVLQLAGRLEKAAATSLAGIERIDELGMAGRKGIWCRCDAAEVLLQLGRVDESRGCVEAAVDLGPAGVDEFRTRLGLAQLHLADDDGPGAADHLQHARRAARAVADPQLLGALLEVVVRQLTDRDPWAALAEADAARDVLGPETDAAHVLPLFAAAGGAAAEAADRARTAGDHDGTARAVAAAASWCDRGRRAVARDSGPPAVPRAHQATLEGQVARARGRADPDAWAGAAGAWEALGVPAEAARARRHQAEGHLACGDRPAATAALQQASDLAARSGAEAVRRPVRRLARRARFGGAAHPPDDGDRHHGLTPREFDVLQLVASGLTDRQIGQRLFISHRTVERHVANLRAKLGAGTRTEAASVAHRDGLVDAPDR